VRRAYGVAIGGRTGAGKDHLFRIMHAIEPRYHLISIGRIIAQYVVKHNLTDDGRCEKPRDTKMLQELGSSMSDKWARLATIACKMARDEGHIPVFTSVRRECDELAARSLGFPIVIITADKETRLRRLMQRDGLSLEGAAEIMDDPETEHTVDRVVADFTWRNDTGVNRMREFARLTAFLGEIL